jgi:hypothetical protein
MPAAYLPQDCEAVYFHASPSFRHTVCILILARQHLPTRGQTTRPRGNRTQVQARRGLEQCDCATNPAFDDAHKALVPWQIPIKLFPNP